MSSPSGRFEKILSQHNSSNKTVQRFGSIGLSGDPTFVPELLASIRTSRDETVRNSAIASMIQLTNKLIGKVHVPSNTFTLENDISVYEEWIDVQKEHEPDNNMIGMMENVVSALKSCTKDHKIQKVSSPPPASTSSHIHVRSSPTHHATSSSNSPFKPTDSSPRKFGLSKSTVNTKFTVPFKQQAPPLEEPLKPSLPPVTTEPISQPTHFRVNDLFTEVDYEDESMNDPAFYSALDEIERTQQVTPSNSQASAPQGSFLRPSVSQEITGEEEEPSSIVHGFGFKFKTARSLLSDFSQEEEPVQKPSQNEKRPLKKLKLEKPSTQHNDSGTSMEITSVTSYQSLTSVTQHSIHNNLTTSQERNSKSEFSADTSIQTQQSTYNQKRKYEEVITETVTQEVSASTPIALMDEDEELLVSTQPKPTSQSNTQEDDDDIFSLNIKWTQLPPQPAAPLRQSQETSTQDKMPSQSPSKQSPYFSQSKRGAKKKTAAPTQSSTLLSFFAVKKPQQTPAEESKDIVDITEQPEPKPMKQISMATQIIMWCIHSVPDLNSMELYWLLTGNAKMRSLKETSNLFGLLHRMSRSPSKTIPQGKVLTEVGRLLDLKLAQKEGGRLSLTPLGESELHNLTGDLQQRLAQLFPSSQANTTENSSSSHASSEPPPVTSSSIDQFNYNTGSSSTVFVAKNLQPNVPVPSRPPAFIRLDSHSGHSLAFPSYTSRPVQTGFNSNKNNNNNNFIHPHSKRSVIENSASVVVTSVSNNSSSSKEPEIKLSEEQTRVLEYALTGESIFFTGPAGCGKSVLLSQIIKHMRKKFSYDEVYITAPTGVAACNIGGSTIHSFGGFGIGEQDAETLASIVLRNKNSSKRWLSASVLVIDEVSMLSGELFDKLEYVARKVRERDEPFGGIQLIMCGDFFQLPPVSKEGQNKSKSNEKFCFEAKSWRSVVTRCIELQTVFRQKDNQFISLLNKIRKGVVDFEVQKMLQRCTQNNLLKQSNKPDELVIEPTRLYPLKAQVDSENERRLEQLPGETVTFVAEDLFKYNNDSFKNQLDKSPALKILKLKIHAQVILLRNLNFDLELVNGATGIVIGFEEEGKLSGCPIVKFNNNVTKVIEREDWNIEVGGAVLATRKQIPLNLAWALSIHKSQGMTIPRVVLSLGNTFEYGQAYVALSRATCLEGLQLLDFNVRTIRANSKVIEFYRTMQAERPLATSQKKHEQNEANVN